MDLYDLIGYSGVLVSSISLCPQICQILNTKQVRDVNICYFFLMLVSEILYISYGAIKQDYVMIASTIPPIFSQFFVIYLHCKYKNNVGEIENN
jgi:uncharacterized protein with PQ loop repeat